MVVLYAEAQKLRGRTPKKNIEVQLYYKYIQLHTILYALL